MEKEGVGSNDLPSPFEITRRRGLYSGVRARRLGIRVAGAKRAPGGASSGCRRILCRAPEVETSLEWKRTACYSEGEVGIPLPAASKKHRGKTKQVHIPNGEFLPPALAARFTPLRDSHLVAIRFPSSSSSNSLSAHTAKLRCSRKNLSAHLNSHMHSTFSFCPFHLLQRFISLSARLRC